MAELYGSSLMETTNEMGSGSGRDDDDDVAVDNDAHSRYGSSLVEITDEVEPAGLINVLYIIRITAFIRTVTFKRGSSESGNCILCDMHNLMPVGLSHVVIYE